MEGVKRFNAKSEDTIRKLAAFKLENNEEEFQGVLVLIAEKNPERLDGFSEDLGELLVPIKLSSSKELSEVLRLAFRKALKCPEEMSGFFSWFCAFPKAQLRLFNRASSLQGLLGEKPPTLLRFICARMVYLPGTQISVEDVHSAYEDFRKTKTWGDKIPVTKLGDRLVDSVTTNFAFANLVNKYRSDTPNGEKRPSFFRNIGFVKAEPEIGSKSFSLPKRDGTALSSSAYMSFSGVKNEHFKTKFIQDFKKKSIADEEY